MMGEIEMEGKKKKNLLFLICLCQDNTLAFPGLQRRRCRKKDGETWGLEKIYGPLISHADASCSAIHCDARCETGGKPTCGIIDPSGDNLTSCVHRPVLP